MENVVFFCSPLLLSLLGRRPLFFDFLDKDCNDNFVILFLDGDSLSLIDSYFIVALVLRAHFFDVFVEARDGMAVIVDTVDDYDDAML